MTRLLRNLSHRALRVWQRNSDVYRVTWKTNVVPPLLEPVLYLVAFGAGVGALLKEVPYRGEPVSYVAFIAPGMLATQAMFQSFFEASYNTFVRMYYQKTFDAIVATPLSVEDVMLGELLWAATRALIGCALMLLAVSFFGLARFPDALAVIPFSFAAGLFFASLALTFTAIVPQIDSFNLPTFLLVMPMFLFSGTFFPIDVLPGWAQTVAAFLPLTHVVDVMREATFGRWTAGAWRDLAYLFALTPPLALLSIALMKRRLIK